MTLTSTATNKDRETSTDFGSPDQVKPDLLVDSRDVKLQGDFLRDSGLGQMEELRLEFQAEHAALWCFQTHKKRPSFTPELIQEVMAIQAFVRMAYANRRFPADSLPKFLVWASDTPRIFNLGGDLSLFLDRIKAGDRDAISDYAKSCIEICWANYQALDCPLITVGVASGSALGGGLESLLSHDIVIVEKSARFGFPEIGFGLFPGMGAYPFVYRRCGQRVAEDLIFSGRLLSGEELFELGLADFLADDGAGPKEVEKYLSRAGRSFSSYRSLFAARRMAHGLNRDELDKVVELWTDSAMDISSAFISVMETLVVAQDRKMQKLALLSDETDGTQH